MPDNLDDDDLFDYSDPFTEEMLVRGIDNVMLVDRETGAEVWRGPRGDQQ